MNKKPSDDSSHDAQPANHINWSDDLPLPKEGRSKGLLSKRDIHFLRGTYDKYQEEMGNTGELTDNNRYRIRSEIRQRVTAGIQDFTILFELFDDDQLKRAFFPERERRGKGKISDDEVRWIRRGMTDMIAVLKRVTADEPVQDYDYFERKGEYRANPPAVRDLDAIYEQVKNGNEGSLTRPELEFFAKVHARPDEINDIDSAAFIDRTVTDTDHKPDSTGEHLDDPIQSIDLSEEKSLTPEEAEEQGWYDPETDSSDTDITTDE